MADSPILITGIAGFVGRHLTAALRESADSPIFGTVISDTEVTAENPIDGAETIVCRLEDRAAVESVVRRTEPSIVYHLAAQSSVPASLSDPTGTFSANVMGTLHLLEAMRGAQGLRAVILVSSAEVYGILPESALPVSEDAAFSPNNPYACSKACADLLGEQYFRTYGVPVIRIRPFNHIGPGQSDAFVTSSFAKQIAEIEAGKRPPKLMVGNLDARRDFTDVRDVIRAYVTAPDGCRPGEAYNLCAGRAVSIRAILDRLLTFTSVTIEVAQDPERMRPSDTAITLGDCSKFRAATGWSPSIPLDQTLRDILDYWRRVV